MLGVPRKKSKITRGRKLAPVLLEREAASPRATPQGRHTQSAAIALILDATPKGEGTRVIVAGASGKGKTYFTVQFVREMQRRHVCSTAVIHDVKDPQRPLYEGKLVRSIAEARRQLVENPPPFLVCRPGIDAEQAASLVKDLAESGEKAALLIDEMTPALRVNEDTGEPQNRIFCGPSPIWLQLQGRGLGASSIILVQLPSQVPSSALDNASAYVFFGLGGRSLDYSLDLRLMPKDAGNIVSKLERGQCCVFFSDREWDGLIYGPE